MAWEPDYTDLVAAKDYLRVSNNNDDEALTLAITAASRAVNRCCGRQFGKLETVTTLRYQAWYDRDARRWVVTIKDIYSTTGLIVTVNGTVVTDYDLLPDDAALRGRPWERIMLGRNAERQPCGRPLEVSVTGLPGWAQMPSAATLATLFQISRWHHRKAAPFGVAGSPQQGSEIRLLDKVDPDVAVMLRDFKRRWAVA